MAKLSPEDHAAVSAAAMAAGLVSTTEVEEGSAPPWCPNKECTFQVLFNTIDITSSRSALSDPGSDGQQFSHLQSIIQTDNRWEEFGRGH